MFASGTRDARRTVGSLGVMVAILLAAGGLAIGASSASAAFVTGVFCPSSPGGTIALNASPDRCVGAYHTTYAAVLFDNALTNVSKCAIIKPNADGSGGNLSPIPNPCAAAMNAAGGVWTYPIAGYAVGSNNSGNYHTGFFGQIGYIA